MKRIRFIISCLVGCALVFMAGAQVPEEYPAYYAHAPRFKALIYYATDVEKAHVDFALQGVTLLFVNAFRWVVSKSPVGDPFQKQERILKSPSYRDRKRARFR